jgi:ABC-type multidrug transport system fused ATPase/permease subunit
VIRLDGLDLRTLTLESVRKAIVLVEQEPTLLYATIEENIRYVRPGATAADVTKAAEAAGKSPGRVLANSLELGYTSLCKQYRTQGRRRAFCVCRSARELREPSQTEPRRTAQPET